MPKAGPVETVESMKKRLKQYSDEPIDYNFHLKYRCLQRGIGIEEVIMNVRRPDKLAGIEFYEYDRGLEVWNLIFKMSGTQAYKVGVKFRKKSLYIKTAININPKWQAKLKKYF